MEDRGRCWAHENIQHFSGLRSKDRGGRAEECLLDLESSRGPFSKAVLQLKEDKNNYHSNKS